MMDISLIETLKKQGYRLVTGTTLRTWKKDDLIKRIRALENNWASALERCENQFNLLNKCRWHIRPEGGWTEETVPNTNRFVEVRTNESMPYYFAWYDAKYSLGAWYDAAGFPIDPLKWRDINE